MKTYNVDLCKIIRVELEVQAETYDDAVEILNKRLHHDDEAEYDKLVDEFEKSDVVEVFYYLPALRYV